MCNPIRTLSLGPTYFIRSVSPTLRIQTIQVQRLMMIGNLSSGLHFITSIWAVCPEFCLISFLLLPIIGGLPWYLNLFRLSPSTDITTATEPSIQDCFQFCSTSVALGHDIVFLIPSSLPTLFFLLSSFHGHNLLNSYPSPLLCPRRSSQTSVSKRIWFRLEKSNRTQDEAKRKVFSSRSHAYVRQIALITWRTSVRRRPKALEQDISHGFDCSFEDLEQFWAIGTQGQLVPERHRRLLQQKITERKGAEVRTSFRYNSPDHIKPW